MKDLGGQAGRDALVIDTACASSRVIAWATWAFVVLGLVTRLVRYLVVYPIWHDEAFVAVNFLDRGYLDLLRPLDYYQVCPLLFLWIELTAVKIFGFTEFTLRLFPAVCGLASVIVFRHVAGRLLGGLPLLLAVAIFATAFYPIRHGAEIKPYASDLLAAVVILGIAVEWWRRPERSWPWWVLVVVVPLCLAVSYPSIFVAAGIAAALGPEVVRRNQRPARLAYVVYCVVTVASFTALYFAFTEIQSNALRSGYRSGYWRASFPPWNEMSRLPAWLVGVATGNTLAYPIGGERGASTATLIAVVAGAIALWRRGRAAVALLLLSPFAMGLGAAALGQYPFGGAARITQYLAPSICLLAGLGVAALLARLRTDPSRARGVAVVTGFLAILGVYLAARDLVEPYRVPGDATSRSFAQWLWSDFSRETELVCVKSDLGRSFEPDLWKRGMSAVYLFHQGVARHATARAPRRLERPDFLTPPRPLRLVFFDRLPDNNPAYHAWMNQVQSQYRVAHTRDFVVSPGKPDERWLRERYIVMELEPRAAAEAHATTRERTDENVARVSTPAISGR